VGVDGVGFDHSAGPHADLIAGAGQAVCRRHVGAPSRAGGRLYPSVIPLISAESLVPHGSPTRFSNITGLTGRVRDDKAEVTCPQR
jgi:hypothetical protein